MIPLIARPVETLADVERMRVLRNGGRLMMRYQDEIDHEQQIIWWNALDREKVRCYLYDEYLGWQGVGFGMLALRDAKWWITLAVDPLCRGKGYGTEIHKHLAAVCPGDLWAEALRTNYPSIRAAVSAGFDIVEYQDRYTVMRYHKQGAASNDLVPSL